MKSNIKSWTLILLLTAFLAGCAALQGQSDYKTENTSQKVSQQKAEK